MSLEEIVAKHMARLVKMGAQDTFLGFDGAAVPIDVALLNYRDQLVECFGDIRFHYKPSEELSVPEEQPPFLSINPIDIKIMTTTKFPSDDLYGARTVNIRSVFKSQRASIRLNSIVELINNAIRELDHYENFGDEVPEPDEPPEE